MKYSILYTVMSFVVVAGCAHKAPELVLMDQVPSLMTTKMAHSKIEVPRAVAVIVHGLNFNPVQMDDFAALFADHGVVSLRVVLTGHNGDRGSMANANAEIWRAELDRAVDDARELAARHDVPLIFLGYSLGGLLGVDWLVRQEDSAKRFDKMILLAPAIATPWYSAMAERMLEGMEGHRIIPTPNAKIFRATSGSSVNAYRALFKVKAAVHRASFKNANVETLVLVDRYDELTPYVDIRDMVSRFHLGQWHLEIFNNRYAHKNHGFRHLIAGPTSIGPQAWHAMAARVVRFLQLTP